MLETLKNDLRTLSLKETITDELLLRMLENIGTIDSELRDDYIFETFYVLFYEDLLSVHQKQLILDECIHKDLLNYGIEKEYSDDVYTRSFTALLLVELLNNHYRAPWLTIESEKYLIAYCMDYLVHEHDRSGKDTIKGWSHAFAHGADLLGALSQSHYFSKHEISLALEIMDRALITVEGLLYGEEGRFARATFKMLKYHKLTDQELIIWIQKKDEYIETLEEFKVNWKNYLITLSFTLEIEKILTDQISDTINHSIRLFYNRFRRL